MSTNRLRHTVSTPFRRGVRAAGIGALTLGVGAGFIGPVQAQDAAAPASQGGTGVVALPTSAPPTGLQARVPAPLRPMPRPNRPQLTSPTLTQLFGRAAVPPIDINLAVAIGLSANRVMEQAVEGLYQAQGHTSETRSAFNPALSTTFTYTRLDKGQSAKFGTQTIDLVNADAPQFNLTFGVPVDIAGVLRAATEQAQFQEIAARLDVNRVRNQIVLDVKNAFYNVLRAQALVTVAQQTLQDDLDRLSDAQKKLAAGTVAPFDVLRAQTDVANAQQQVITARSNVNLSIANLNATLGIDVDSALQVTDQNAVEIPPLAAPPTGTESTTVTDAVPSQDLGDAYRALVQEAQRNRPEILEADAQIAAARKGIKLARRSALPTMNLAVNGSYSPNAAGLSPVTSTGNFSLSITLPILDGGLHRARVSEARASASEAETSRRTAVDQVSLDVRSAYLALVQARDRVAVANQALDQAKESYRLARVRYNNGISTLVEVSDAQAALTQAENNQVNALYDYNNDRAALDRAVGRYAYVGNAPGFPTAPDPGRVSGNDGRVHAAEEQRGKR